MDFKDYYEVLGVAPDVDDKTLKTAYRKLARKYHPDVSKEAEAEARFKEVAEAYDVLRDPHKRAEYDQIRLYQQQGERFQVPPDWQPGSGADYSDPHAGFGEDYSDFSSPCSARPGVPRTAASPAGAATSNWNCRCFSKRARPVAPSR